MILSYNDFYRKFGVRLIDQIVNPTVHTLDKFSFPKNSIYHYCTFDGIDFGPRGDSYLLREITKPIQIANIFNITDLKGNPRINMLQTTTLIRDYTSRYKRFRNVLDKTKLLTDDTTLVIFNYNPCLLSYRYTRAMFTEYFKWWNIQKTIFSNISIACDSNDRQNFLFTKIPTNLNSLTNLNLYAANTNLTSSFLNVFNTQENWFFLEVWKWLSIEYRANSIFSNLKDNQLSKINLVFQDNQNWICFNLGTLNSWIDYEGNPSKTKLSVEQIQKRVLRSLISLMSKRSSLEEPDDSIEEDTLVANTEDDDEDITLNKKVIVTQPNLPDKNELRSIEEIEAEEKQNEETAKDQSDRILQDLDEDFKFLETIENKRLSELENNISSTDAKLKVKKEGIDFVEKDLNTLDSLKYEIDKFSSYGTISAVQYKKLIELSEKHSKLQSPYDSSKTLLENSIVTNEELQIKDPFKFVDRETVVDKSMLESTLIDFDQRYVQKVLPKHILGMVLNTQKAGIIVSDYQIDQIEEVMGDYEIHTVKVQPIEGMVSTLRFKLPKITEDGYMIYNGNKYRQRKQRSD